MLAEGGKDTKGAMDQSLQDAFHLNELLLKQEYTDVDTEQMKVYIGKGLFPMAAHFASAQFRVTLELIQAIRKFDAASGRLVETTNQLTRRGLWLSGVAIALSLASLSISVVVLVK